MTMMMMLFFIYLRIIVDAEMPAWMKGEKKVNIKLGIKYVRQMAWKSRKQQEHITYEGT